MTYTLNPIVFYLTLKTYYNTRAEFIDTLENPYGDDKEGVSDWIVNSNR